MSTQPLRPFAPPPDLIQYLPNGVTPHLLVSILFYFVIIYWLVYTAVAIYHWFVYAHNPALASSAVVVHGVVSLACIGLIVSGLV